MSSNRLTPRQEKAKETRRKIFEAAVELFSRKGYDQVTVDDICARVGVSKGAFYTHFKSKNQVLLEQFKTIDDFYKEVSQKIACMKSDPEKLRVFWNSTTRFVSTMGVKAVKVVFHEEINPARKTSYLAARNRPIYSIVEALLSEGQEFGYVRKDISADELTRFVVMCWRGLVYNWCLVNGRFKLEDEGDRLFEAMQGGLAPR